MIVVRKRAVVRDAHARIRIAVEAGIAGIIRLPRHQRILNGRAEDGIQVVVARKPFRRCAYIGSRVFADIVLNAPTHSLHPDSGKDV